MKETLDWAASHAVLFIDALALAIVLYATIEAFVGAIRVGFSSPSAHDRREVWMRYARWLIAGLTFQLAADIIESSISTSWESLGRLAGIAAIRTFLNYFLERDLADVRDRQRES